MKSSTLTAREHLAAALESINKAQEALYFTGEQSSHWLLVEAIGRVKEAKNAIEVAGGYVVEVHECEVGSSPELFPSKNDD